MFKSKLVDMFGSMQQKEATQTMRKALEEDPTVFQYDELFDEMDKRRSLNKEERKDLQGKKPKYIHHLMKTAERRQQQNERRIEKQAQKELEKEGDMYKDKESFLTGSYKRKMEELKRLEEEEKREDALDEMASVTKQKDLSGFYRHLYRQTLSDDLRDDDHADNDKKDGRPAKEQDDKRHVHHHRQERRRRRSRSRERDHSSRRGHKRGNRARGRADETSRPVLEQAGGPLSGKDVESPNQVSDSGPTLKLSEHPVWKKRTVGATLGEARDRYLQRRKDALIIAIIVKDN